MNDSGSDYTIKSRIVISGFECCPSLITSIVGINPSKVWKRGDKVHQKATNAHKENGWIISSPCDASNSSIDEQVISLSEIALPVIDNFMDLPEGTEIELSCIVRAYKYMPSISFSLKTISFLSMLKATVDIDVYDLIEEEAEEAK